MHIRKGNNKMSAMHTHAASRPRDGIPVEPWSSSLVQDQVPSILRRNLRSYVDNVSE